MCTDTTKPAKRVGVAVSTILYCMVNIQVVDIFSDGSWLHNQTHKHAI